MQILGPDEFIDVRKKFSSWKKKFPMFAHNVIEIEHIVENHIQNFSKIMVDYRRTKRQNYLDQAQKEIDEINRILSLVEKYELMALLSNR